MSDRDEIMKATDELRYRHAQRKTMERKDPWIPESQVPLFSEYARALVELLGNDRANDVMSEAVITALGKARHRTLQLDWISSDMSWIDMCHRALRDGGKEVP